MSALGAPWPEAAAAARGTLAAALAVLVAAGWLSAGGDGGQQAKYLTPADINALPSKPADARIRYGPGKMEFGDLRLPRGRGPFPVAIVLHGGCWVSQFADLQNTAALADALRDAGIATWNVEYTAEDQPGGGWPGTMADAGRAADKLREIAASYRLDTTRVIAIGHSAGGHLALWLAARHRLPQSSPLYAADPLPLRGVVALGGVGDLAAFRDYGKTPCEGDVVGNLLGGGPEQVPGRYRQASPAELLPLGVPQVLIEGAEDETVPARFAQAYAEAARRAGDKVRVFIVPDSAHHEYNAPHAPPWPYIKEAAFSLLRIPLR
ncbi:MAG TPA: alpha/beta hydrolase [Candidatus Acidoferrales bacterium]|nr:alpha/beta hydrolase [Candidatus Acidoferrales bacterium]